jgi:uncharacterized protein (TIGR02118 family)
VEDAVIKLTVLYGHPKDPAAFERYYAETHMPIAEQMRGVRRIELAKAIGTPDGRAPAFYRMAELYFDSAPQMQSVMATPEAKRTVADLANFATGGVTTFISEIEE